MKEYFNSHLDARKLNEFLNVHSEDSRGDCASIILQAYAIRRYAEGVVQATAHLENKMESSVGVRGIVVAGTYHQGVVLVEKRTDC